VPDSDFGMILGVCRSIYPLFRGGDERVKGKKSAGEKRKVWLALSLRVWRRRILFIASFWTTKTREEGSMRHNRRWTSTSGAFSKKRRVRRGHRVRTLRMAFVIIGNKKNIGA